MAESKYGVRLYIPVPSQAGHHGLAMLSLLMTGPGHSLTQNLVPGQLGHLVSVMQNLSVPRVSTTVAVLSTVTNSKIDGMAGELYSRLPGLGHAGPIGAWTQSCTDPSHYPSGCT